MSELDFSKDVEAVPPKVKKGKRKVREDGEPEEDILDRFTEPTKKRKKKEKKEISERERRNKLISAGKVKAEECFNVPLSAEEITLYEKCLLENIPSVDVLKKCSEKTNIDEIGYVRMAKLDGIYCVLDFIAAASHCTEWLDTHVKNMGWSFNTTGYNPISVSHSTDELLSATLECYKMAAKQMLRMLEAKVAKK